MATASRKTGDIELGRRIAARRGELGMSRKDLAEVTGLSYPHIAQIETGYRLPSAKHQPMLSKVLGMSLDELFGVTDDLPVEPLRMSAPPTRTAPRRRGATMDEAVELATQEIEALPVSVRLEALAQVQLRVMQGVTTDQARRLT
ncbi:helix-turn-helix domain-containing protein [Nocardioides sp. ChNu-153]|uniref:helix-turn-helix domain-containing protein n=1 Tax=Nocardioides sp. ChNu-153 TaxID=2779364 RepID=UPI0026526533|nr:helix-turn-helix domain-containing protein [Nocardioides sp. ChNu-153]MDN7121472.1 helix-turn-helix domain-containing protein [Nocardioides sp. ChNu-153]